MRILRALSLLALLALPSLAASTYQIDPAHSEISFRIRHLGLSRVYGRFVDYAGTIVLDEQDVAQSKVEVTIQAASIDTANEARDKHLRSEDFFDTAKHPTLAFRSVSVKALGKDRFEVTGDFTMRGVTKRITIPVAATGTTTSPQETRTGFEGSLTLSRYDYGMNFMPAVVGEEVSITLGIAAVKVAAKP